MARAFAVIGLGAFGRRLCEVLAEKGGTVVAIDNQAALIERVKETVTQAVLLDSTDEDALRDAPLEDIDVAVVAIGDNIEASILTTTLLKRLSVPYVVARAVSELHQQVLVQVGANEVINLEIDEGTRLANRLIAPQVLDRIPVAEDMSVAELYVPRSVVDATLAELNLRERYQINVISIKRSEVSVDETGSPERSERIIFPEPGEKLQENDIIMVVGSNEKIDVFRDL